MLTYINRSAPWVLGLFRIVVGFLFFCHGASTLFAWPVAPYGGSSPAFGAWPSWWAGVIELVAGIAIMLGIGTRTAAFLGSGTMAVAYFWKHVEGGLILPIENDGDSAALFCWALFLLVFTGPGRPALDELLPRRRPPAPKAADTETATATAGAGTGAPETDGKLATASA